MKRCPKCRRDYADETLNFCFADVAKLAPAGGCANRGSTILGLGETNYDKPTGDINYGERN